MMRKLLVPLLGSNEIVQGSLLFALFLFGVLFVGVLIWVNRGKSNQVYQHLSQLPLEEDTL